MHILAIPVHKTFTMLIGLFVLTNLLYTVLLFSVVDFLSLSNSVQKIPFSPNFKVEVLLEDGLIR